MFGFFKSQPKELSDEFSADLTADRFAPVVSGKRLITLTVGLILIGPTAAFAHGEQIMAYPLSAVAAVGIGLWIVGRILGKWWARIICLAAMGAAIYQCWEHINPEPVSLYEGFLWWTLLLTAIPISIGAATAFALRHFVPGTRRLK